MPYQLDDTIVAIASPPEGALRGIIRLSGIDVAACLRRCCSSPSEQTGNSELGNIHLSETVQATVRRGQLSILSTG